MFINSGRVKIAVLGLGMTGEAVIHGFLQRVKRGELGYRPSITFFEPNEELGTGFVYNTKLPRSAGLVNTSDYMAGININSDRPGNDDFFRWILANYEQIKKIYPEYNLRDPKSVVPRSLYGRYLLSRLKEMREFLPEVDVQIKHVPLESYVKMICGRRILMEGSTEMYDAAFLTTGHTQNSCPPELQGCDNFYPTPYPLNKLDGIKPGSRICIVGTGPTACELAIYLLKEKGVSYVELLSRSGRTRAVRGNFRLDYQCKEFTVEALEQIKREKGILTVKDVTDLVLKEIRLVAPNVEEGKITFPKDPERFFKYHFEQAKSGHELVWLSALMAISKLQNYVLENINPAQRTDLHKLLDGLFAAYKTPMPLDQATILNELMESGKLKLGKDFDFDAFLKEGSANFGPAVVRVAHDGQEKRFDGMIFGSLKPFLQEITPPYAAMLESGVLKKGSMGIEVDRNFRAVGSDAAIYVLGSPKGHRTGTIQNQKEVEVALDDFERFRIRQAIVRA